MEKKNETRFFKMIDFMTKTDVEFEDWHLKEKLCWEKEKPGPNGEEKRGGRRSDDACRNIRKFITITLSLVSGSK